MKAASHISDLYRSLVGRASTLSLVSLMLNSSVNADFLVVPNEQETVPGAGLPSPFQGADSRYLNVYKGSEFISAMPQGGLITAIAFRVDEGDRGSFSAFIPELEIRMSTSSTTPPFIPESFAANVGKDETVVFPKGPIRFTVVASGSGPNPFDLRIPLQTPFLYDPRQGSLSVDLWVHSAVQEHRLAVDAGGGNALALQGALLTGSRAAAVPALIIQTQFTPIPEPTTSIFVAVGILCVGLRRYL